MKSLFEIIETKETNKNEKIRSEREFIVNEFCEKINARSKKKFSVRYIGILLNIYTLQEMYILMSKCNQAKNFPALFWYFVKPKKLKN